MCLCFPGGPDSGGDPGGAKDDGSQFWDGAADVATWPTVETGPAGEVSWFSGCLVCVAVDRK